MIILKNKGEIEIETITTMGVNVKECDSPIGFFGTGLKFAIATFLREGIAFALWIGENRYEFYSQKINIRNKTFNKCFISGPHDSVDLGFVTDMGKNWKIWQAYREIHSNCLDEKGEIFTADSGSFQEAGFTTFVIQDEIDTKGIFLDKTVSDRIFFNDEIEIFKGESEYIYYHGIRAKDLRHKSIYTYNILRDCDLTEDRLLCYDHQVSELIADTVATMEDKEIIEKVVTASHKVFESNVRPNFYFGKKPNDTFVEVCNSSLKKVNHHFKEHIIRHTPKSERTKEQRKNDFLVNLRELCNEYKLDPVEYDHRYGIYVEIRGDLLND